MVLSEGVSEVGILMALGLERCFSLVNRMKHSEVSVFKELDTNVRYAVDIWSRYNPSVSAVFSTTFPKNNNTRTIVSAQFNSL